MYALTLIRVSMDGDEILYTFDAYKELRLCMSTGDFHVHKHEVVEVDVDIAEYVDVNEYGEFYTVDMLKL